MKKRILFGILIVLMVVITPVSAAYKVEKLPDGSYEVTFTYQTGCEDVFLIGEFNNWLENDEDLRMMKNAEGIYEISIFLEKGSYEYKFFADGQYYTDPTNPDVVGGFANSLVTVSTGAMLGEMAFNGKMINELSREGETEPVQMNNDLSIKLEGLIKDTIDSEDGGKTDRFAYYTEIVGENSLEDIENPDSDLDYLTLDEVYINQMNLELFTDYVDYSLQLNLNDHTDSCDYIGLVDANTANDNRDYTQNINDSGDVRRFKLKPGKGIPADYNFDFAITEYTSNIGDSSSVKKYYSLLNFSKDFRDSETGLYKGQAGFTGMAYQPVVVGNEKELALSGAVFAEYEAAKNLRIRGEYAWIPRGNISESLSGTYEVSAGKWKFIFDPRDYELEGEDISEVHLAGTFNSWDPNNFDYPLEKNEEENVWEGIFEIAKGEMFKWIVDGQWTPDGMGNDLELKEKAPDAPLSNGQLYMAEANYKVFDTMRSFRNGIHSYSFDITGGYEVLENQAYLPLALDNLAADKELGHNKVYVYGYLYPQKNNNLRFTLDAYYQTAHEDKETEVKESEELSIYSLTPGFEFPEPFSGIEYIKAYVNIGKRKGVIENGTEKLSYDWTDSRHGGFEEIRSISGEIKTKAVGPLNYFLFSVNNEENLKVNDENKFDSVSEIFVETELNIPVEQIAYTKMNLDYKLNDETAGEQREPRYWVETKIHHIPGVEKYLTHFLISYESDQDGIIDEGIYNDNNNDWQKRVYAETKLIIPEVENFELTLSLEAQELEEGVYPDLEDLDKELNARYVAKGKLIEWYTFALITAAYDFPYGIRADLSLKYDLNHNEISKYEDDALKLELSKILNEYTTLKGSYNSKHPDYSSEQFINIGLETLF